MPNPSGYDVNWDRLVTGTLMTVQPQRWEALVKRLKGLSRNGVANFVTAMIAASPVVIATVANLDEAELRATYEGPLSAAYLAHTKDTQYAMQRHVSVLLGDNRYLDPLFASTWPGLSGPEAALGVLFGRYC